MQLAPSVHRLRPADGTLPHVTDGWAWDPTLYSGAARCYARGRLPYPSGLAAAMREALGLDGRGRLLDIGCGPGIVTLLLAPLFEEAVGVDADADMLAAAAEDAGGRGLRHCRWVHARAEELPAGLGRFRLVTFAQSFHWLDRPRVAAAVRDLIEPEGALALVGAWTAEGPAGDDPLPRPEPPRAAVAGLVRRYLGPLRRAGQGVRTTSPGDEEDVLAAAGYRGPEVVTVPDDGPIERSLDEVVASVYSTSYAAPHLFGERLAAFDAELRALLLAAAPDGRFAERTSDATVRIWRL